MPRLVKVAATQLEISRDPEANLVRSGAACSSSDACSSSTRTQPRRARTRRNSQAKAEAMVRKAAAAGANIILLQELFENWYFCQEQKPVRASRQSLSAAAAWQARLRAVRQVSSRPDACRCGGCRFAAAGVFRMGQAAGGERAGAAVRAWLLRQQPCAHSAACAHACTRATQQRHPVSPPACPHTRAPPDHTSPHLARLTKLAAELGVVLPVSFFERCGAAHFNSLAVIDADGRVLGVYRKSHIPDGPG